MAAQIRTYAPVEEFTLEQLRATIKPAPAAATGPTLEVIGRKVDPFGTLKQHIALEMAVAEAVLPHQLHEIDTVVEIAHLQEMLAERESRVSLLTMGIAQWRERALAESNARRREAAAAHDRERELIRVIHSQMTSLDNAEAQSVEYQAQIAQLQGRIGELQTQQSEPSRRWWRRSA